MGGYMLRINNTFLGCYLPVQLPVTDWQWFLVVYTYSDTIYNLIIIIEQTDLHAFQLKFAKSSSVLY